MAGEDAGEGGGGSCGLMWYEDGLFVVLCGCIRVRSVHVVMCICALVIKRGKNKYR